MEILMVIRQFSIYTHSPWKTLNVVKSLAITCSYHIQLSKGTKYTTVLFKSLASVHFFKRFSLVLPKAVFKNTVKPFL